MMGETFLQLFLYFNIFIVGVVAAIATQHAYAHFRPHHAAPEKDEKPRALAATAPGGHLPPAVKEQMLQASQANFQAVLDRTAAELQHDLQMTTVQLNKLLHKLGTDIVSGEMERYHHQLDQLRQQAEQAIGGAQTEIDKHQAELQAKLEEQHAALQAKLADDIAAEKQRIVDQLAVEQQQLAQQIDSKLGDAVASFLLETMQHNVDLGAQSAYLTGMLEEHKADFKREISHEA